MKHIYILVLMYAMLASLLSAQTLGKINAKPNRAIAFDFHYAAQMPYGELANRFGFNSAVGAGFRYKTQDNFLFGVMGNFLFGNILKDSAISFDGIVSAADGMFVNQNGQLVQARLYERGMSYFITAGKVFSPKFTNKNSGLMVQVGAGYIQHQIRIEIPGENVPQLQAAYKRGYDKLHSGIAFQQYIGWHFMQFNQHYINFNVGVEIIEGFTQNRRGYNYDTRSYDTKTKTDIFAGLKFTWFIPRYLAYRDGKDEYYFK